MLLPVSFLAVSNSLILVNCKKCIFRVLQIHLTAVFVIYCYEMYSHSFSFIHSSSPPIVIAWIAWQEGMKMLETFAYPTVTVVKQYFTDQNRISKTVYCIRYGMVCKIGFTNCNAKIALLRASMVVTYCIKLFRAGADRHNGILTFLLLLVAETISYTSNVTVFLINPILHPHETYSTIWYHLHNFKKWETPMGERHF